DASPKPALLHREGANLGEILPHDVQCAAADGPALLVLRDQELLNRLIEDHALLAEENVSLYQGADQPLDRAHITGAGGPHGESHFSILRAMRQNAACTGRYTAHRGPGRPSASRFVDRAASPAASAQRRACERSEHAKG